MYASQHFVSREDRLRELDRERQLYSQASLLSDENSESRKWEVKNSYAYRYPDSMETPAIPPVRAAIPSHSRSRSSPRRQTSETELYNDPVRYSNDDGRNLYIDLDTCKKNQFSKSASEYEKVAEKQRAKTERELKNQDTIHRLIKGEVVTKGPRIRTKVFSDRAKLEEINSQYGLLEIAYHKLLSQVQKLQNTHLVDMRTSEQRFNDSSRAMQKALVLKSDDLVQTTNKLAHISAKYDRESRQWVHDKRTLRDQLMGLGQDFVSLEAKFENRNQLMEAGNHQRQELAERVVLREQDLGRYSKSLREKDMQLKSEMEARSLAEIQSRQREDNYNRMAVELKELKDMYERRTNDVKDLEVIKKSFSECKRELSDVTHREKNYLLEIEQLSVRERKLYAESEELSTTQRKNFNETSRLNTKISGLIQEIEIMKNVDVNLRNEIKECSEKSLKSIEENKELTDLIRQARNENNRLMRDLSDSQSALRESSISNSNIHEEIKKLQISEQLLKNERDNQNAQLSSISSVLQQKREEIDGYSRKVSELTIDLQNEISEKDNLRNMNKDKLAGVSDRISELQSTLQSTTLQMQELQQNEVQYRQVVRTKDDSIRLKSQQVSELQDTVRDLQKEISTATIEMQDVKTIKREEFLTLQDKFAQAKLSMQQEVLTLRDSLTKKTSQLVTASDELNKLKQGLNEFSADRFTLESRLSELMSSESSYQRQVANFQMQIHTKNQELQRTFAKQQAFEDQIKILEEEVKVYRNGGASNDGDIQRLQNNMQQLSKRLKNQVDVLLEKDEITTPNHLRSPSSESQGGRYSLSTTLRKPVLNVRIADDYDNIDRLLAKSPQTLSQI